MRRWDCDEQTAYPYLKWAGGKAQLLEEFTRRFPPGISDGSITHYVEPFVGGGAVFFHITQKEGLAASLICDINPDLCLSYEVIKDYPEDLIACLQGLSDSFHTAGEAGQKEMYLNVRDAFNTKAGVDLQSLSRDERISRVGQIIFLNRTCFNGLYRVNSKGGFNVPFGKYRNPKILDANNIRNASRALLSTTVRCGDFSVCGDVAEAGTFVYLDPPYRPLNQTAFFTSYARDRFFDEDQVRLVAFFRELDRRGAKVMLSNSDPRNENPDDDFFDRLYEGYTIHRVPAKRYINSNGKGRGEIMELIVMNYEPQDGMGRKPGGLDKWGVSD
jgi:DNA adenine methylase